MTTDGVLEKDVPDRAERNCTYVFPDSGWRCAALPSGEIHTLGTCVDGHPEVHHEFVPEVRDATRD